MQLSNIVDDDIFVSYCRSDSTTYTDGIAAALTKRGFSCFTDALGTDACETLPPTLKRKVTSCRMLVLIASPDAARSAAVQTELELFTAARGSSSMVVIDFANSVAGAIWKPFVIGLRREIEPVEALHTGNPATPVLDRIEKAFTYRKLKDRLQRYTKYAIVTLGILIIASIIASIVADRQFKAARRQQQIAQSLDLANQSQALLSRPDQILNSAGKAIESAEIMQGQGLQTSISDYALRQALAFLPERRKTIPHPGSKLLFAAAGGLMMITSKDTIAEFAVKKTIYAFTRPGENAPFFRLLTEAGASITLSKDGTFVAWSLGRNITVVNTRNNSSKTHNLTSEDHSVKMISLSPDGRWLAIVVSGMDEGDLDTIQLWDCVTDSSVDFPPQGVNINSIVFNFNNTVLAAAGYTFDQRGGATGEALLWDFHYDSLQPLKTIDFQPTYSIPMDRELTQIAPGFDNSYFATSTDSIITVWQLGAAARHHAICYIPSGVALSDYCFVDSSRDLHLLRNSPKADTTVTADPLLNLFDTEDIWNAQGYRFADWYISPGELGSIAFDPQTKKLMASDNQSPPHLVNLFSGTVQSRDIVAEGGDLAWQSPDLRYFITMNDHIRISRSEKDSFASWRVDYDPAKNKPDTFNLTHDGRFLSFIQLDKKSDTGHCRIDEFTGGQYRQRSSFPVYFTPKRLVISEDGMKAYELCYLDTLIIWDISVLPARPILRKSDPKDIFDINVSPDGRYLCLRQLTDKNPGDPRFDILLLDLRTMDIKTLATRIKQPDIWQWTPDGNNLMIAFADRIQGYSIPQGSRVFDEPISDKISSMTFDLSGKLMAFGSFGGVIRIIETSTLTETSRIDLSGDIISMAFSDDDRFIYAYANSRTFLDMQPQDNYQAYKCLLNTQDLIGEAKRRIATLHP